MGHYKKYKQHFKQTEEIMGFETLNDKLITKAFENLQKNPAIDENEIRNYSKKIIDAIAKKDVLALDNKNGTYTFIFNIGDFDKAAADKKPEKGYEIVNNYLKENYGTKNSTITVTESYGKTTITLTGVELYGRTSLLGMNPFNQEKVDKIINDAKLPTKGGKQTSADYDQSMIKGSNNYLPPKIKGREIQLT